MIENLSLYRPKTTPNCFLQWRMPLQQAAAKVCSIAYVFNSITFLLKIAFLNSRFNYFRRNSNPQIQNDAETLTQTRHSRIYQSN